MRARRVPAAFLTAIACIFIAGCSNHATITSAVWPYASREATSDAPAGLVKWPLTGEEVRPGSDASRRALSVKVENDAQARPQVGLGLADVVYETITEGGITRFNAIFHSRMPLRIGPVRSARLSDATIVSQYRALFFFSGSSASVREALKRADVKNLSPDAGVSAPYSRAGDRRPPHNEFLDTTKAYDAVRRLGLSSTGAPSRLLFGASSSIGEPISSVSIPFSPVANVQWRYDPATQSYVRYDGGKRQLDARDGRPVQAQNVVVMWTKYAPASRDRVGSTTYDISMTGSGRVSVFTAGRRYDGTWEAGDTAPPVLKAEDASSIKLMPGSTWFEVVPLNVNVTMQ